MSKFRNTNLIPIESEPLGIKNAILIYFLLLIKIFFFANVISQKHST